MSNAFQADAFQSDAFQAESRWTPLDPPDGNPWVPIHYDELGAFQLGAFQSDAFQIGSTIWTTIITPTVTWTPLT